MKEQGNNAVITDNIYTMYSVWAASTAHAARIQTPVSARLNSLMANSWHLWKQNPWRSLSVYGLKKSLVVRIACTFILQPQLNQVLYADICRDSRNVRNHKFCSQQETLACVFCFTVLSHGTLFSSYVFYCAELVWWRMEYTLHKKLRILNILNLFV